MKQHRKTGLLALGLIIFLLLSTFVSCIPKKSLTPSFAPMPVPVNNITACYPSFNPASIVVAAGTTVTWTNHDDVPYFIVDDSQNFAINLPAEGSFTVPFTDAGMFNYHCMSHPSMQGTITVLNGVNCRSLPSASPTIEPTNDIISGSKEKLSPLQVASIEAKTRLSVVAIDAETTSYDISGNSVKNRIEGTGWIYDKNGLILTNNHVVENATSITVTLDNGQRYSAKTVRTDPIGDLAVIDIGVDGLPALTMGDSSLMKIGDYVIAIGDITGNGIRVTQGIISGTDVTFNVKAEETLYDTLETTAEITYGNSGGPLINMDGEVIGITTGATMTINGEEVASYAISSNIARPIIRELIEKGYVTRAWLGITVSDVEELQAMGYKPTVGKGAYIISVANNSPASKCGLRAGDIIVKLDGRLITSADDLVQAIRSSKVAQKMEITYWHNSTEYSNSITAVQNPEP